MFKWDSLLCWLLLKRLLWLHLAKLKQVILCQNGHKQSARAGAGILMVAMFWVFWQMRTHACVHVFDKVTSENKNFGAF